MDDECDELEIKRIRAQCQRNAARGFHKAKRLWSSDNWEEMEPSVACDVIEARELLKLGGGVLITYGFRAYPLRQRFENIGGDRWWEFGLYWNRYRI